MRRFTSFVSNKMSFWNYDVHATHDVSHSHVFCTTFGFNCAILLFKSEHCFPISSFGTYFLLDQLSTSCTTMMSLLQRRNCSEQPWTNEAESIPVETWLANRNTFWYFLMRVFINSAVENASANNTRLHRLTGVLKCQSPKIEIFFVWNTTASLRHQRESIPTHGSSPYLALHTR